MLCLLLGREQGRRATCGYCQTSMVPHCWITALSLCHHHPSNSRCQNREPVLNAHSPPLPPSTLPSFLAHSPKAGTASASCLSVSVYSLSLAFLSENKGKMSWCGAESQVSWSSSMSKPHFPPLTLTQPSILAVPLLSSCPPSFPLTPHHLENFYSTLCPLLRVTFSGTSSSNPHLDWYICSFHVECLL